MVRASFKHHHFEIRLLLSLAQRRQPSWVLQVHFQPGVSQFLGGMYLHFGKRRRLVGDHLPWPSILHVALKYSFKLPAAPTKDRKK